MPEVQAAWEDLKGAILSDPCIRRFDHRKLIVLHTNFSSLGFGFVLLQPGNDEASVKAAQDYLDGKGFSFMTKGSAATCTRSASGLAALLETKVSSTPILVKVSLGITPLTNVGSTSLVSVSFG